VDGQRDMTVFEISVPQPHYDAHAVQRRPAINLLFAPDPSREPDNNSKVLMCMYYCYRLNLHMYTMLNIATEKGFSTHTLA
jgi:hypothetical protein